MLLKLKTISFFVLFLGFSASLSSMLLKLLKPSYNFLGLPRFSASLSSMLLKLQYACVN